MADITSTIEALEHRLMRGWIEGDAKTLKSLLARDFRMLVGARQSLYLDRASWIEAITDRFTCSGYRMNAVHARKHGRTVFFAARFDLDARLDDTDWSGPFLVTDLWRKSPMRRRWLLVERTLARPETREEVSGAIRALQLWN